MALGFELGLSDFVLSEGRNPLVAAEISLGSSGVQPVLTLPTEIASKTNPAGDREIRERPAVCGSILCFTSKFLAIQKVELWYFDLSTHYVQVRVLGRAWAPAVFRPIRRTHLDGVGVGWVSLCQDLIAC